MQVRWYWFGLVSLLFRFPQRGHLSCLRDMSHFPLLDTRQARNLYIFKVPHVASLPLLSFACLAPGVRVLRLSVDRQSTASHY